MKNVVRIAQIALVAMLSFSAQAAIINVAVIQDSSNRTQVSEVLGQLNDSSVFDFNAVEVSQNSISSLADLSSFDAIILGGSGHTTFGYSRAVLEAAADFMTAGGGVVTSGWWYYAVQNLTGAADLAAQFISPVDTSGSYQFSYNGTQVIVDAMHAITNGVSDFYLSGCCIERANSLDAGAVSLGTTSSKTSIAYQDIVGRSVYLGPLYMSSSSYSNDQLRSGNADKLFEQAVAWSASGSPTSVPVPASLFLFAAGLLGLTRNKIRA